MIFNTHTHLNSEEMYREYETFLKRAQEENVSRFLVVGYDLESSKKAIEIAEKHENVYASVGLCPTELYKIEKIKYEEYEKLLANKKVVAIGEIGLDYYYETTNKLQQKECLLKFFDLAKKYNLPVLIHCRDALQDCYDMLKENKMTRGVMHCYSGSVEMAKNFIKQGLYISLAGPVTFKNAKTPKEVAKEIDLNKLLVETDDPYLAPTPFRGQKNEPKNVVYIVKAIAEIKGISFEEVAKTTTQNALEVLNICEK